MENEVSVVIPVYNAEKTLDKCINSLLNLNYSNYNIIFVDDESKDNTRNIILNYSKKHPKKIKLLSQHHKGPAAARNIGWKNSTGNIIFFTDSDVIVTENWIKKIIEYFKNKKTGAVGGGIRAYKLNNLSEKFEQYRRNKLYGNGKKYIDALPACNLAVRKEILEKVGGFDESFKLASSEDYDLCYSIRDARYKILYDSSIEIIHYHSQNWKGVFRRGFIHGMEGVKLRKKRGRPITKEILGLSKVILLPILIFRKYPLKLLLHGFIYELNTYAGKFRGILKYANKK